MKHTAKSFHEGQQPLLRKELNEKALINNNDTLHGEMVIEEGWATIDLGNRYGQEEIMKTDEDKEAVQNLSDKKDALKV